jgi:hypothetical protein
MPWTYIKREKKGEKKKKKSKLLANPRTNADRQPIYKSTKKKAKEIHQHFWTYRETAQQRGQPLLAFYSVSFI